MAVDEDGIVALAVRVFIGRFLPQLKDLGQTPIIGGAAKYGEEILAYTVGHLRVGRLHALPGPVLVEAFLSLPWMHRAELIGITYAIYLIATQK